MQAMDFMGLLKQKPFIPLRIHMSDGKTYEIFHPDNVLVMYSRIDIGVGADPNGVLNRVEHCSLEHVVRVEELFQPAKAQNGKG